MPAMLAQLLGVALLCGFAIGAALLLWRRRHARGDLARLARRMGFNYLPDYAPGLRGRLGELELLSQGHNRHLGDIVSGSTRQGPVYCFRYRYERGWGVDRATYRWAVAALEVERAVGGGCRRRGELPDAVLGARHAAAGAAPAVLDELLAALGFAAALECRGHLISLQAVDDGTNGQYETLLAAVEEAGRLIAPASETR